MSEREQATHITIRKAARRAGLETQVVSYCVELGLVDERLTDNDLRELRRVRRLKSLGVNMAGVEIILRMRRKIKALQAEVERLRALR